jgi:hypothetical protein
MMRPSRAKAAIQQEWMVWLGRRIRPEIPERAGTTGHRSELNAQVLFQSVVRR